jgi:hypothetical protein
LCGVCGATYDIGRLDVFLKSVGDLLLKVIKTNLVILNNQVDLELLDTETNGNELATTPDETLLLDGTDTGLKSDHVGLIVPRLNVKGDDGLGGRLNLTLLLLSVLLQALLTDPDGLGILLLVVGAEKVDILIIILSGGSRGLGGVQGNLSDLRAVGGVWLGGVTGEGLELIGVGSDVLVPSGSVGVLGCVWGGGDSLEGGNIGLGGVVAIVLLDCCPGP